MSVVLDEIDTVAKARGANVGAEVGPVGVFEDPAYRETRQQAAEQYAPERFVAPQIYADIDLNGSTSAEEIIRADRNRDGVVTGTELDAARLRCPPGPREAAHRTNCRRYQPQRFDFAGRDYPG